MSQDVAARLAAALDTLARDSNKSSDSHPRIHRIVIKIDPIDPLDWLRANSRTDGIYWQDRDDSARVAAIGEADSVTITDALDLQEALRRITRTLKRVDTGIRYFGGLRFDPERPESLRDNRWDRFAIARFVLPRFEIIADDGKCYLACNFLAEETGTTAIAKIIEATRQLSFDPLTAKAETPPLLARADSPDRAQWNDLIADMLKSFTHGDCDKLVLARRTTLEFGNAVDPWHLLKRLRDLNKHCFVFGFQPDQSATFIGASPEQLYSRTDNGILTEALAGTRPAVADKSADNAFAAELLESSKDRREHELVVDGVAAALDRVCERYSITESHGLLRLQSLQHLITRFEGQLRSNIDDCQLLSELHPTPAVGGTPGDRAVEQLRTLEPIDRGWYAGPVGWIGADRAEFAVAIRSALIHDRQIDIFAGAGIVGGSEADIEWIEVENKIIPFLILLYSGRP